MGKVDINIEDKARIEDFKSRIIIITNKPKKKIPSSLVSRSAPIEINVNISDIIDNIRINIEGVMSNFPEATTEIKLEVLNFIEDRLKGKIDVMDYRLFERAVVFRLGGNPAWKKFVIPLLKSA